MITEEAIRAILPEYPSHAAAAGIAPRDWAIERLSHVASQTPAPVAEPAPRELSMPWSDRQAAELDRTLDPRRAAQDHAEEQRIVSAIEALDRQLLPLQQRRAVLMNALSELRFRG